MKHKLESRLPGEISITSDMQITPPLWLKPRRTKELLDEGEKESEKAEMDWEWAKADAKRSSCVNLKEQPMWNQIRSDQSLSRVLLFATP